MDAASEEAVARINAVRLRRASKTFAKSEYRAAGGEWYNPRSSKVS